MIETIRETTWHDEVAKRFFVIPKGTQGFILRKGHVDELDEEERWLLTRAKSHYKKREQNGIFVYLERKYRWLNHGSYKRV